MTYALLNTKLYVPTPQAEHVSRPYLVERVNAGLNQKLVLISAPAGFGKTTLLGEWIAQAETPIAWVSLDEDDNDAARFFAYIVAALQGIDPNSGRAALAMLQAPRPPGPEILLTSLINDLTDITQSIALVLDDYHVIQSQRIHNAVTFLLDHLPPQMHMVIATRADPPLPIARLRASSQLTEVRAADLRFTREAAVTFLNEIRQLGLSTEHIAALTAHTEGWIAGLQMAAVSMQGRGDAGEFIRTFTGSNRYVLDYLVEEVLQRQPDHVQRFLLETSVLTRFTGPLCDAVTESEDGQQTLETIEHANLFIIPLDDRRCWYRYHHLFADLLRQRLQQTRPELVPELHRRASQWYERNGLMSEAIEHALAARDFQRTGELIHGYADTLWAHGQQATLTHWLEQLPKPVLYTSPKLCVHRAMLSCMAGQLDAADQLLHAAEDVLAPLPNSEIASSEDLELSGYVATARAYIALFQYDVPAIIQFGRQALELLPNDQILWRSAAGTVLGSGYDLSFDYAAANQTYERVLAADMTPANTYFSLLAGSRLAVNLMHQGQLRQAGEVCQRQLDLIRESGFGRTDRAGGLYAIWGGILYEWNNLEDSTHYVEKSVKLCEQGDNIVLQATSYLSLIKLLSAKRDRSRIEETLQKLERLVQDFDVPAWVTNSVIASKAKSLVAEGSLATAEQLLRTRGLDVTGSIDPAREVEYLALAYLWRAQEKYTEALRLLDHLFESAGLRERMGWIITIQNLRAIAFQAQGNDERALETLAHALTLAVPEGYVRTFVDNGPQMAKLLYKAAERGIAPNYVGTLLAAFPTTEPLSIKSTINLVEPVTDRELEVLQHIAAGASNAEIAQELVISVNTVKKHVTNIFGKLAVTSRTQAVARARDLGLVD